MRFLNGSSPTIIGDSVLESASRLYSVLHFTSGKVGASSLWRKSVDETLTFAWGAFLALRTTFPSQGWRADSVIPTAVIDFLTQVNITLPFLNLLQGRTHSRWFL